jgi:hypothetical protein
MRHVFGIAAVGLLVTTVAASAQDLNGSFYSPNSGETFTVESNHDGTSEINGSDGRHVGTAQDNGDGTWDVTTPSGRRIGEIQDNGDGTFDVHGSQGGYWGSGETDE